ncbi:MAG: AAA family ATPase [Flavobacteriaceae bacterium]|nr:AAA family ATPase [Flavobacteriaceae bacterium]
MSQAQNLTASLLKNFDFEPTKGQQLCFYMLAKFLTDPQTADVFVLKGFAGTGKTTMLNTLIKSLKGTPYRFVQMAPTGRAAKVMKRATHEEATTIHKKIYYPKSDKKGGVSFTLQENKHKQTLFLVDEASMISDEVSDAKFFENGSLLEDLLFYVAAGEACKLIFIGDTAQLPPVKQLLSPALNEKQLSGRFIQEVMHIELDEVMRQVKDSGILYNATVLRNYLQANTVAQIQLKTSGFEDVIRLVDGYEIQEALNSAFSQSGREETTVIVRSNKRANLYNQQIRERIFFKESELSEGDFLMVVKNNYFWLEKDAAAGFIANGDMIEVVKLIRIEELYGFKFAKVKVRMVDYEDQAAFECVLLLDTLTSEGPSLTYEESNRLYQEVSKDFASERSKYKQFLKIKTNPYFNALQVKFSYAITCHKSQGGQWKNVFVEHPYLPNGYDEDALRWLYTAFTRASEKLYLIGFKDDCFE